MLSSNWARRFFCSLFLSGCFFLVQGQVGYQGGLRVGRILEVLPRFPEVKSPGIMIFAGIHGQTGRVPSDWGRHLGKPQWSLDLSVETFGNNQVLGLGIGLLPSLHFALKRKKKVNYTMQLGYGLSYLTRPYDKFNTENRITGSHLNFMAILGFHVQLKHWDRLWLMPGLSISHYSNGGFANPNIGVNVPSVSLAVQWKRIQSKPVMDVPQTEEKIKRWLIRPFIRGGLGFTEQRFDGPKFSIYSAAAGIHARAGAISLLKLGAEFSRSEASLAFIEQVGLYPGDEIRQASRWAIFGSHDLLFGYFAFHTEAGIYLLDHHDRLSVISTRIGFSFFAKNALKKQRNIPGLGLYVRAYQGEADYVELSIFHLF